MLFLFNGCQLIVALYLWAQLIAVPLRSGNAIQCCVEFRMQDQLWLIVSWRSMKSKEVSSSRLKLLRYLFGFLSYQKHLSGFQRGLPNE